MPANRRKQTAQSPASPTAPTTAKYTNKDGSKFITVPKVSSSSDSSEPSPGMAQTITQTNGQTPQPPQEPNGTVGGVNRKKQKRRQKQAEAARLAAGQTQQPTTNGGSLLGQVGQGKTTGDYERNDATYDPAEDDRAFYSDEEGDAYSGSYEHSASPANGYTLPPTGAKTSKKKDKGKAAQDDGSYQTLRSGAGPRREASHAPSIPPPLKTGMSKEKIWNTSSQEERERIKLFWLSLGEEERRSLVKVEKDAVLKKMKEQQKHSCSCTVCGRKRVAIEEELEVLYDAYYEELEQYANNQQGDGPPPLMAASRRFGPMSGLVPPNRLPPAFSGRQPSRGKIVEHFENEDDEDGEEEIADEEYSEDDYISDDEPAEEIPRSHATDFFNFGQSLTVQGGILTVADDLLKNDGKKFIEMMEQLAERRMAREEDAKEQLYSNTNGYGHPSNGNVPPHSHHGHNHPPPPDDEDYDDDEEDDDEYDSQDDDYDDEEMDTMTEEQRMEEGRRMFQIFAARMFEQRVLTAYKEKVAAERQEKLIQELDEENMAAVQKKAKKAKDAQKKKEKAQQKKLALAEEKSKRDAEKAADVAALRAADEKKAEEARLKAEEKRKKREAQKKAEEEERIKKESEKQRRLQEQRERQAETERKQREAKERDRKEKEEIRQKEREAREAKEREARDRREKQEKEKRDLEAKVKAEKEASEQQKHQEQATQHAAAVAHTAAQTTKRLHQQISIPMPAGLQSAQGYASPHIPVATPVMPKAPTPNRPATTSQRDSTSVPQTPQFGKSQSTPSNPSTPHQTSPGPLGPGKAQAQQPLLHHPQATSPIHAALKSAPIAFQPGSFPGMQSMGVNNFHPGMPMVAPGFGNRMHHDPMFPHQQPMSAQFRPLAGPNGIILPGMNGMPSQQGRSFQVQHAPPGFSQQQPNGPPMAPSFGGQKDAGTAQTHSRQHSASFEKPPFDNMAQPIARPGPIGRPGSVVHSHRHTDNNQAGQSEIDDLSHQLGSSALLDDSDDQLTSMPDSRRTVGAPGGMGRQSYQTNVPFSHMDPSAFNSPISPYNSWTGPPSMFGAPTVPGNNFMAGWGATNVNNFGAVGAGAGNHNHRPIQPRSIAIRQMLCRACKNLEGSSPDGFHGINSVRQQLEQLDPLREEPLLDKEILDLCETEGNSNNGGGYFDVRLEGEGRYFIRFEPDAPSLRSVGAPGDIGSQVVGSSGMPRFPPGISAPGGF